MELLKASAVSVPHSQERQLFPFRRDVSWRVASRHASVLTKRGKLRDHHYKRAKRLEAQLQNALMAIVSKRRGAYVIFVTLDTTHPCRVILHTILGRIILMFRRQCASPVGR